MSPGLPVRPGSQTAVRGVAVASMPREVAAFPIGWDDPLALLPRTAVREYSKNQVIYDAQNRSEHLYLVIDGRVKVSRQGWDGKEVVLEFYQKDEFFGESGLLGTRQTGEQAVAVDGTSVMLWSVAELKQILLRTPALAPALLRVLAQKVSDARDRIESFCLDPLPRRLARALVGLAERLGEPDGENGTRLRPITHEQLARYLGTSREIVTQSMNRFRREGLLKYSRRGLEVDVAALKNYLSPGT